MPDRGERGLRETGTRPGASRRRRPPPGPAADRRARCRSCRGRARPSRSRAAFAPGGDGSAPSPEGSGVGVQAEGRVTVDRGADDARRPGLPAPADLAHDDARAPGEAAAPRARRRAGRSTPTSGTPRSTRSRVSPDRADALEDGAAAAQPGRPADDRGGRERAALRGVLRRGSAARRSTARSRRASGYDRGPPRVERRRSGSARPRCACWRATRTSSARRSRSGSATTTSGSRSAARRSSPTASSPRSTSTSRRPEGWAAYQDFVATGALPEAGTAGTVDPTTSQTLDYSDRTKAEVRLPNVTLGGTLGSSEGHIKVTEHADGTVEVLRTARYRDVGPRDRGDAGRGRRRRRRAALLAAAARRRRLVRRGTAGARRQQRRGPGRQPPARPDRGRPRGAAASGAREQLADRVRDRTATGGRPLEEIGESLADGDGIVELGRHAGRLRRAATASSPAPTTPEEMLIALYRMRGGRQRRSRT